MNYFGYKCPLTNFILSEQIFFLVLVDHILIMTEACLKFGEQIQRTFWLTFSETIFQNLYHICDEVNLPNMLTHTTLAVSSMIWFDKQGTTDNGFNE